MKTVKGELVGTLDHLQELRNVLRRSQQKAEERKAAMEKLAAGLRWTLWSAAAFWFETRLWPFQAPVHQVDIWPDILHRQRSWAELACYETAPIHQLNTRRKRLKLPCWSSSSAVRPSFCITKDYIQGLSMVFQKLLLTNDQNLHLLFPCFSQFFFLLHSYFECFVSTCFEIVFVFFAKLLFLCILWKQSEDDHKSLLLIPPGKTRIHSCLRYED